MAEKIVKDSQCLVNDLANDCISRQAAIDALGEKPLAWTEGEYELGLQNQWQSDVDALNSLPSAQPEPSEITDEQAILHLQSIGWMQNHDREMYESGLRERLADDSEDYNSLIPCEDTINRQAAIDALHMHLMYRIGTDSNKKRLDDWINSLPSAHPEIIRCRECRHWYTGDGYNHENGAQCELTHMWMGPDDYCSYGRRKVSE